MAIPPETVSEEEIQEYIDGRLSAHRRSEVEAYLALRPERAAEVHALLRQQEALRRLGQEILNEPIPERLQDILRRIPRRRSP
jgi:anti-sigma factor RsiW